MRCQNEAVFKFKFPVVEVTVQGEGPEPSPEIERLGTDPPGGGPVCPPGPGSSIPHCVLACWRGLALECENFGTRAGTGTGRETRTGAPGPPPGGHSPAGSSESFYYDPGRTVVLPMVPVLRTSTTGRTVSLFRRLYPKARWAPGCRRPSQGPRAAGVRVNLRSEYKFDDFGPGELRLTQ